MRGNWGARTQRMEPMQKTLQLMVAIVATLGMSACGMGTDTDKIADEIKLQDVQWSKDYESKDPVSIDGHYASDGVLAGPGFIATTSDARRQILRALLSDPNYKQTFSPDHVEVAKSGDLAVSRGHFAITMTDTATNQPVEIPGYYITVYKKDSDSKWKASARFLTRGPLPVAAEAAVAGAAAETNSAVEANAAAETNASTETNAAAE